MINIIARYFISMLSRPSDVLSDMTFFVEVDLFAWMQHIVRCRNLFYFALCLVSAALSPTRCVQSVQSRSCSIQYGTVRVPHWHTIADQLRNLPRYSIERAGVTSLWTHLKKKILIFFKNDLNQALARFWSCDPNSAYYAFHFIRDPIFMEKKLIHKFVTDRKKYRWYDI